MHHRPRATPRPLSLALCLLLAFGLCAPHAAFAKRKGGAKAAAHAASHKHKVKSQRSPSEESAAERDRRLYRECQGLPNAGACLGYAKP